jgi:prolyl-tRNA synthetase
LGENGQAEKIYDQLKKRGVAVLYDDRDISVGAKLADADLIGIPWRLVVSKKTGVKIELKERSAQSVELLALSELVKKIFNK